jgi:hypothetical protein
MPLFGEGLPEPGAVVAAVGNQMRALGGSSSTMAAPLWSLT